MNKGNNEYTRNDIILFILSILLFSFGPIGTLFLSDAKVGWLFSFMGVTVIVLQFTVLKEVRNNLNFISEYFTLTDHDMKWFIDYKLRSIERLVRDAKQNEIQLNLDDLFLTVTHMADKCKILNSVDIGVERWLGDVRSIKYLEACRRAALNGAKINRIFVLDNELETFSIENAQEDTLIKERFNNILNILIKHELSKISIYIIFKKQIPATYFRDFGIFDREKILDERFDALGNSLYTGFFSTDPRTVREYTQIFNFLRSEALNNQHIIENWLSKYRSNAINVE